MPTLTIDGRSVQVDAGKTVLDAARKLGLSIPTLCFREGCRAETSCMVCVVRLKGAGKLIPSCATRAVEGMVVESETDEVKSARRIALDLLLSEHVGDCEAPCKRACPAHMDIPLMIRQIRRGELRQAIITIKRNIPLPAVLGRICAAPCEKACRRAVYDAPVSICLLKRFAADMDLTSPSVWLPARKAASGKKVAIVGAGPTGLSAAFYLLQEGHACKLFDDQAEPGGLLRHGIPEDRLPRHVLDNEIDVIRRLGAEFQMKTKIGHDVSLADLEKTFDAVVLTTGAGDAAHARDFGVEMSERGIKVAPGTFQTSKTRVFACGDAVQPARMVIRDVAQGKAVAVSVNQLLSGQLVTGIPGRFNSHIGKLKDGEMEEFLKEAERSPRHEPRAGLHGYSNEEAVREAGRCLHCDCRKEEHCRLRDASNACGATQQAYAGIERKHFQKIMQHADIVYEPGKCIKCGLCVQVTARTAKQFGLGFIGRGFDVQIAVPFNESLGKALEKDARRCVEVCPTGALSDREEEEVKP